MTRRKTAKTMGYKYKVAVNPTKQKKRTWEEGRKVRKVGRAVTFDASKSEKETRERLRGGAKNHGANGSLRGGEDHTGSRLRESGARAGDKTRRCGGGVACGGACGGDGRIRRRTFSCFFAFALLQFSFGFDILKR